VLDKYTGQERNRRKIASIDIGATISKARNLCAKANNCQQVTKSIVEILILILSLLANRLNLNSTNSSKPPSNDPNRTKGAKAKKGKQPSGQKSHLGTTLRKSDEVVVINGNRKKNVSEVICA